MAMKTFRAYARLDKLGMRRKGESLQIASVDLPGDGWQFTFVDPTQGDELVDPMTSRTVDKVSYTEYVGTTKAAEGHDAVVAFDSKYPYNNLVIKLPNGTEIRQDSAPHPVVIGGVELPEWTLFFNVISQAF